MTVDPETLRQIEALSQDRRPLLVSDVDEVVLDFVDPFTRFLASRGYRLASLQFRLTGNVVDTATGALLDAPATDKLLGDFFADQAAWQVPAAALVEVYQAADALVSVSLTEGFPVTVLEGMACGLPVVATDVTGNRDVVRDGDNGYLVGVEQLNTIPDRIGSLAADLPLRGRLGDAARRTAARYDWDGIVSAYLDAYERARRP